MKLIYRALVLESVPRPMMPYCKPKALNWRFHASGESYDAVQRPTASYCYPRVLNWRFRMAVEG